MTGRVGSQCIWLTCYNVPVYVFKQGKALKRTFLYFWVLLLSTFSAAAVTPLPAEQAFQLSTKGTAPNQVTVSWKIAAGYHLYRDQMKFSVPTAPVLPPGKKIDDPALGKYEVYDNEVSIPVDVQDARSLTITYQGCSSAGFCYPPTTTTVSLGNDEQNSATQLLMGKNLFLILAGFLGFGLLLALTPCIFPMVPILSSIILGQGDEVTTRKAFVLSLTYVLAMAVTYAGAGVIAAWTGHYLQAFFQNPWVLILASIFMALLALSLFGLYELRLPNAIQQRVMALSQKQRGGTYVGVAVMGCLATLVVSPCVSAPLVGALGYISSTGDMRLGGSALFSMGLGMGLPLLIIGTYGTRLLPKAGKWMQGTKIIFGVLLLAVAVSLLWRIIPPDLFSSKKNTHMAFQTIKSVNDLKQALAAAKREGKPVLLDFYADWCISCKKMDKTTFNAAEIGPLSQNVILLRADVTMNNAADKQLLKSLGVVAPPTIVFFDPNGKEIVTKRVIGEIGQKELMSRIGCEWLNSYC